jgi:mRNA interferase MazF
VKISKFHIYTADLNPRIGTEPGKTRPVVVIQTNLLNVEHPSTIICPITSKIFPGSEILRVHIPKSSSGLEKASDILVDQIRAIDNRRFIKHIGKLTQVQQDRLLRNLKILIFE